MIKYFDTSVIIVSTYFLPSGNYISVLFHTSVEVAFCNFHPLDLMGWIFSMQIDCTKIPGNFFHLHLVFYGKRKTVFCDSQMFYHLSFLKKRHWKCIIYCIITEFTAAYCMKFFLISILKR